MSWAKNIITEQTLDNPKCAWTRVWCQKHTWLTRALSTEGAETDHFPLSFDILKQNRCRHQALNTPSPMNIHTSRQEEFFESIYRRPAGNDVRETPCFAGLAKESLRVFKNKGLGLNQWHNFEDRTDGFHKNDTDCGRLAKRCLWL